MILKKGVSGYVIWAFFALLNVILICALSFTSGLFLYIDPTANLLYCGLFTALSASLALIVFFLLNRLCVYLKIRDKLSHRCRTALFALAFAVVLLGAVFFRLNLLKGSGYEIRTGTALFHMAEVTDNSAVIKSDSFWKLCYLKGLRCVLMLAGNRYDAALNYQLVLSLISILLLFATVRILSGRIAGVCALALVSCLPVYWMKTDVLDAYVMFSVMLGLCGVVSAATVRMTCSCISSMARYRILCLVCGIIYGFLIYSDAGVLLFLAAVLYCFIISRNNSGVVSGLAFLLPGIIAGFASGLLAFNSLSDIFGSLSGWGQSFFGSGFSFEGIDSIGSDVMLHFVVYIILAVVMFGALSGFHYSGQYSGMTPWLLLMMLICLVSPFMGITLVNSLEMMTTAGICVFSAGLSASVTEDGEDRDISAGTEQAEAQSSESRQEDEVYGSGEIAKARAAARVISPERNITDAVEPECEELVVAAADEKVSSETVEDAAADSDMSMTKPGNNPELSSEVPLEEAFSEGTSEEPADLAPSGELPENHEEVTSAPDRLFIPEGMVVPVDDEVDSHHSVSDELKQRQKRNSELMAVNGKLKVGRRIEKASADTSSEKSAVVSCKAVKQDDFDIPFTKGDDFDI